MNRRKVYIYGPKEKKQNRHKLANSSRVRKTGNPPKAGPYRDRSSRGFGSRSWQIDDDSPSHLPFLSSDWNPSSQRYVQHRSKVPLGLSPLPISLRDHIFYRLSPCWLHRWDWLRTAPVGLSEFLYSDSSLILAFCKHEVKRDTAQALGRKPGYSNSGARDAWYKWWDTMKTSTANKTS